MMIHRMADAAKHSKAVLLYGIALTMVFHYFRVDLTNEPIETHQKTHVYYIKKCVKIGYMLDDDLRACVKMDNTSQPTYIFLASTPLDVREKLGAYSTPTPYKSLPLLNFQVMPYFTLLLVHPHPSLLRTYLLPLMIH